MHEANEIPPLVKHTYNIPLSNAVKEYHSNTKFKRFVDSGLFAFADERIVIAGDRYVERQGKTFNLTPYAVAHLDECALWFGQTEFKEDKDHKTTNALQSEYQRLHLFDPDSRNSEIFDKAKALTTVKKAALKYHNERTEVRTSFYELFNIIYEQKKWNSTIFKERTLLDKKIHSFLKNQKDYKPSKRTILAIAVGAELDIKTTEELFLSAGYSFDGSLTDDTYRFVLNEFEGSSIEEVNEVLATCNIPLLGSLQK